MHSGRGRGSKRNVVEQRSCRRPSAIPATPVSRKSEPKITIHSSLFLSYNSSLSSSLAGQTLSHSRNNNHMCLISVGEGYYSVNKRVSSPLVASKLFL